MSRKVNRVPVRLNTGGIRTLPMEDIKVILRGADPLIMGGGRNLLVKLLKGSRAKEVLEKQLDECPVYGRYRDLKVEEVQARVDWCIAQRYLAIEYDWRLPLLVFTRAGWKIARETYAEELLRGFDELIESETPAPDLTFMRDVDREVVHRVLDMIEDSGDTKYLPILESWKQTDYRKVCKRIGGVMRSLRGEQAPRSSATSTDATIR